MNFDFDRRMESEPLPLLKLLMRTNIMHSDDDESDDYRAKYIWR